MLLNGVADILKRRRIALYLRLTGISQVLISPHVKAVIRARRVHITAMTSIIAILIYAQRGLRALLILDRWAM